MVSQNKLIKQGIKYTDQLFDEISKRLEKEVKASDTLESFLGKYNKAFPDNGNPLITLGYDKQMLDIILSETNNHRFSRPAQKELVRVTIENQVGELIRDVGDDIRESIRDIVKEGYDNNLSQDEIAVQISSRVSGIKGRRALAIARTEVARAATISDYVVNAERGATHFYVECRNTACPVCKKAWHDGWTVESDDSFKPGDTSAGGRGWIGDKYYPMSRTDRLPPIHPNCRCVPYFVKEGDKGVKIKNEQSGVKDIGRGPTTTETTTQPVQKEIIDSKLQKIKENLTDKEFEKYQKLVEKIEKNTELLNKAGPDDPRRIMYESRLKSDKKALKRLEDIADNPTNRKVTTEKVIVKSGEKNTDLDYNKINTYEDLADYFGFALIEETDTQYGKSTTHYILRDEKNDVYIRGLGKYDFKETKEVLKSFDEANPLLKKTTHGIFLDPTTNIKELGDYSPSSGTITIYSHKRDTGPDTIKGTVTHEMAHAFDDMLNDKFGEFFSSVSKEYRKIVREEGWGSAYSYRTKGSTRINEDFAETGKMVLNRDNPNVKIRLKDGTDVTAKEWCEMFPKKVVFFEKLLKSKKAQELLL